MPEVCPACGETLSASCWETHAVPYESYMMAIVGPTDVRGNARLIVRFPAYGSEDNQLHFHPFSARRIRVIEGTGWFLRGQDGDVTERPLSPGDVQGMAKNVLHTFFAGPKGMIVESWHYPFVGLDGEEAILYQGETPIAIPERFRALARREHPND